MNVESGAMDVEDLNLFVRIARLRSISSAARDLNLTPAGASARLAALERRLGARLLHRTTRQTTLTEDGLAFLPHAEHVVLAAEAALAALGREQAVPRGTLRVAAFRGKGGELIERRITPRLRINDGGAVRDAACAGLGVALMATWCAADELRSGALVPALPEYPLVSTQTLWALYASSRELAPKVRVFIDWLTERYGRQPYWDRGLEAILESGR